MTNDQIDDLVLRAIGDGCNRANAIVWHATHYGLTERSSSSPLPTPGWRLVDKSLQRLRKRGAISYQRKTGWRKRPR